MGDNYGVPQDVEVVIKESQSEILANLKLTGISNEDCAKQLGVSLYRVRKIQEQEDFKKHLREASDHLVTQAANTWKGMMNDLIPLAHKTLVTALKRGDLKGVEIVIKTLGIEKQVQQTGSGGNLQIILPDYKQEKSIDVEVK